MSIDRCINKKLFQDIFKSHAINVQVCLPGGFTFGDYYDPFRQTGGQKEVQNAVWVKALCETLTGNSLIFRQFGLAETGAVRLTVKDCDVEALKVAKSIKIDGNEYYAYHDACGNRFQIFPIKFGYSKVILFRKEV